MSEKKFLPLPFEKPKNYGEALKNEPEKIDSEIHNLVLEIESQLPPIIPSLRAKNSRSAKAAFLSGETENPSFEYREAVSTEKYIELSERLRGLEKEINSLSYPLKQLYILKINNLYNKLNFLRSIGHDAKTFTEASIKLWGDIPQDLGIILEKECRERRGEEEDGEERGAKAKEDREELIPSPMLVEIFNNVLEEYGFFPEWMARINPQAGSITVEERSKIGGAISPSIEIPLSRKVRISRLESLVAHEIGVHIFRGEAGRRTPLALIGYQRDTEGNLICAGGPGSGEIEEGLGKFAEAYVEWFREDAGEFQFRPYSVYSALAVWYAREYNFRGVFEKLRSLGLSKESAYKRTVRVFRGISDPSRPGFYCTLDATYRLGSIIVADFYMNNPQEIDRLWIGKIGSRYLGILSELGIEKPALPVWFMKVLDYYSEKEWRELRRRSKGTL